MIEFTSILGFIINLSAVIVSVFFIVKLRKNGGNKFINNIAISLLICNILLITNLSLFYFIGRKVTLIFMVQLLTIPLGLFYGPFVYLYCKALAKGQLRRRRKDIFHLIPAVIFIIYFINNYGIGKRNIFRLKDATTLRFKDVLLTYLIAFIVHGLIYIAMAFPHLLKFRKALQEEADPTSEDIYFYLKTALISFLLLLILNIYFFIINFSHIGMLILSNFVAVVVLSFLYTAKNRPHIFWTSKPY